MEPNSVDQVIVTSKPSIYYFVGDYLDSIHRPLALIIYADGNSQYYVNRLLFIAPACIPICFSGMTLRIPRI